MHLPAHRRSLLCLLAVAAFSGCASVKPDVHFDPAFSVPPAGLAARATNVIVTTEPPQELVAQGLVRIGMLDVAAKRDATSALLLAARQYGADAVSMVDDNRSGTGKSAGNCVDIKQAGEPAHCKEWNTETGVCRHWSAPTAFECRKWETVQGGVSKDSRRATLWRREPLAVAIAQGGAAVRAALAAGADPNAGWTPLYYAIDRPDSEALRALLAGGARPDSGALGFAARTGRIDSAKELIAAGAPVREVYVRRAPPPVQGTTPLHEAVRSGDAAMAELLITHGADVNAIPAFGSTALKETVRSGNAEMVRVLIEHGADPRLKDLNGGSAMDEAKARGQENPAILELLSSVRGN